MIIKEYYKKQGIIIVSNETFSDEEEIENQNKKYLGTKRFLETLAENRNSTVKNADDLWNQLAFLDRLSFIDSKDFSTYSTLKRRALNRGDSYSWFGK
ncbi:MAG: hypothetical protein ACLROH_05350 [Streptococcus sp.]